MYRAVAWKALHDRLPLDDEDAVADLARRAALDVGPSVGRHRRPRRDERDPHAGNRSRGRGRGAPAESARGARRAPAAGRRARRHCHGRARYRVGRLSECRREDLPRRVARRARAPACGRSGARDQPGGRGRGCRDRDGRARPVGSHALDVAADDSEGRRSSSIRPGSRSRTPSSRCWRSSTRAMYRPTVIVGRGTAVPREPVGFSSPHVRHERGPEAGHARAARVPDARIDHPQRLRLQQALGQRLRLDVAIGIEIRAHSEGADLSAVARRAEADRRS